MIAPDKIWAQSCKSWDGVRDWDSGDWGHQPESDGEVQYTRSDLVAEAERTAWNAAIEAAVSVCRDSTTAWDWAECAEQIDALRR